MSWLIVLVFAGGASNARLAVGLDEHVGARVPMQLSFTDSTGRRVALGDYFDGHRPVVLVMAYARCQMLCSLVLRGVAEAIAHGRGEPGVDYLPIVVSLDPRETTSTALHYQDKLLAQIGHPGDRARWPYVVGDQPDIAALADALGFRYAWDSETQQYAHPAVVFVIGPDGRIAEYVRGVTFDDLPDAVDRARAGALTPSAARDILSCFHFDPATRRYGHQMMLFLRLGAATVVLGLVLVVFVARRRRA
ncbi:MAG TPA: SCO family protein [Kofleriaceae bacterium]|jgi:protein SCO1/2